MHPPTLCTLVGGLYNPLTLIARMHNIMQNPYLLSANYRTILVRPMLILSNNKLSELRQFAFTISKPVTIVLPQLNDKSSSDLAASIEGFKNDDEHGLSNIEHIIRHKKIINKR